MQTTMKHLPVQQTTKVQGPAKDGKQAAPEVVAKGKLQAPAPKRDITREQWFWDMAVLS